MYLQYKEKQKTVYALHWTGQPKDLPTFLRSRAVFKMLLTGETHIFNLIVDGDIHIGIGSYYTFDNNNRILSVMSAAEFNQRYELANVLGSVKAGVLGIAPTSNVMTITTSGNLVGWVS